MSLSKELQLGKSGEHLVCFDLISQGHNAFLADQGLPYDVLVDVGGSIKKIQVKTTEKLSTFGNSQNIYRFGTRRGRESLSRVRISDVDYYAFVAIDIKKVAYFPIKKMLVGGNKIKQTVDFKSRLIKYIGRVYSNGTIRTPEWGKYFQDYGTFK